MANSFCNGHYYCNSWALNHNKTENNDPLNFNGHHFMPRVKINGILMIILALELN